MNTNGKKTTLMPKEQRGSRPRCVLFTDGPEAVVAERLTALVAPFARVEPGRHAWQPKGWTDISEAKLGETPPFLSPEQREIVSDWWLAVRHKRANTPNWDIVSQATISGREGLILVEAKAHANELHAEGKLKTIKTNLDNHGKIGQAISVANNGLNSLLPGWNIFRDTHYQLSNRFAWAWKLATLGIPVILVYLGFLNAEEMRDQGEPFASAMKWEDCVRSHSNGIIPKSAWESRIVLSGGTLTPLIRSADIAYSAIGFGKGN